MFHLFNYSLETVKDANAKINSLAYLEIYTVLAVFFCRFDMQLEHPAAGKEIGWSDHFAKSLKDTVRVKVLKDHWDE